MENWRWSAGPYYALGNLTLEEFRDELPKGRNEKASEILIYSTKAAINKRERAKKDQSNLFQEVLDWKVRNLRAVPDGIYGDAFEALICKLLDKYELEGFVFPKNETKLATCQKIVTNEIRSSVTEDDLVNYLTEVNILRLEKRFSELLNLGLQKYGVTENAKTFTLFMFELDQRKTDEIWGGGKFLQILERGLKGEQANLVTMLCLINDFDNNGGYTAVSDLFAYRKNSELKPIPEIIQEMFEIVKLFEFYGVNSGLTVLVADTDYTETGRYGTVTPKNIENIKLYVANLVQYTRSLSDKISVIPFSELSFGDKTYKRIKTEVFRSLTRFNDIDFDNKWGQKFQDAVNKITESQKKKQLIPERQIRQRSNEITKKIWACNAAEGSVFCNLGKNIVFLSAEKRERDGNYVIDKCVRDNFPPVLYILQTTQDWYRITGK